MSYDCHDATTLISCMNTHRTVNFSISFICVKHITHVKHRTLFNGFYKFFKIL